MRVSFYLNQKQQELLQAYRKRRREERGGKVLQVVTAISELMDVALKGESVKETMKYDDLVQTVQMLHSRVGKLEGDVDGLSREAS